MTRTLLLEGGAEFGGQMRLPDLEAMKLSGGATSSIRIIPTAAAPDNNHARAGKNGVDWFTSLGAMNVRWLPIIDQHSANDAQICKELQQAKLITCWGASPITWGKRSRIVLPGGQPWKPAKREQSSPEAAPERW